MDILVATTGVLPAGPVGELCGLLAGDGRGTVTVTTVVKVPRTFLDALDEDDRRSLLDEASGADPEDKAARYLEERGQTLVDPLVSALHAYGVDPDVEFIEGDDPAEAIIASAEKLGSDLIVMGATRRLFTEEAWKSVSVRVMESARTPVLTVPGPKIEDTMEMPPVEF
ncbi:MAG: hypothetical protein GEU79_14670 [Acidimicrobiia bacterium]|nr:hypothetical protein [Acidimicrobiia bacterium]